MCTFLKYRFSIFMRACLPLGIASMQPRQTIQKSPQDRALQSTYVQTLGQAVERGYSEQFSRKSDLKANANQGVIITVSSRPDFIPGCMFSVLLISVRFSRARHKKSSIITLFQCTSGGHPSLGRFFSQNTEFTSYWSLVSSGGPRL